MKVGLKGGILLVLAILSGLATLAVPAHATITPVGAAWVLQADNTAFISNGGTSVRCPQSTLSLRISADGRSASGTVDAHGNTRGTCVESVLGTSCTVTIRGRILLFSTASVANTSASFNVNLDRDFDATVRCPGVGFARSILGPQASGVSCATFGQGNQTLNVGCTFRDPTPVLYSASYRVIAPNVTVS